MRTVCIRCAVASLVLAAPVAVLGQTSPNGPQFQVNSYTTLDQSVPAAAMDGKGNFVVTWDSDGSGGTDKSFLSIQARRFDAHGAPLGPQFQVNTYTTGAQYSAAVAMSPGGDFVVAWVSDGSFGTDAESNSIQARRYDAAGQAQGPQFQVNTYTTNGQQAPAVAIDTQGNFVIVWHSNGSSGTDTSGNSIQGRRYDAAGAPLSGQFQVNTYTTSSQNGPAVATTANGDFVVAWESNGSDSTDTSYSSIRMRRYDATGVALANDFQVNDLTTDDQRRASVARDAVGNIVVAWESDAGSSPDTSDSSIQAQVFSAGGGGSGEFQVNTYTTDSQFIPKVAMDAGGGFVVVWTSEGSSGTDTDGRSVHAQRYLPGEVPLGGELQVNTYTTSAQNPAAVGMNADGDFVIAWASLGSSGTDTSDLSIQAQRYDALFRDGFEGGSTGRWSAAVPSP